MKDLKTSMENRIRELETNCRDLEKEVRDKDVKIEHQILDIKDQESMIRQLEFKLTETDQSKSYDQDRLREKIGEVEQDMH
jgi:hypothetical protein